MIALNENPQHCLFLSETSSHHREDAYTIYRAQAFIRQTMENEVWG